MGYHGCDRSVADAVVLRDAHFIPSDKKYDWVGPGVYFWESDPLRAWEWADARAKEKGGKPAVVGAIIDLRNCLDLLNRIDQEMVRAAHMSLVEIYAAAKKKLPVNRNGRGGDHDRRARELDCDVIKHLHSMMDYELDGEDAGEVIPHFDTVRGMFTEGDELYPGAAFYHQSHVQIAVRNLDCIKGVFFPPELDALMGHSPI